MTRGEQVWPLTLDCAYEIYGRRKPTAAYAKATAQLLYGTWAQESGGGKYLRQIGFTVNELRGGWSEWQLEIGSVTDSLNRLARYSELRKRSARWLWENEGAAPVWWKGFDAEPLSLMLLVRQWPRLACLFARLHYMRVPEPIPGCVAAQALYWKDHYNTRLGKGTSEQYIKAWLDYHPQE